MANRYWAGGTGTWDASTTTNWSTASSVLLTSASCTGTTLTTTGSPALVAGMTVWSSTYVSLGTITGGSGNSWTVSVGGTYASQTMSAATIGASVPTASDSVFFDTQYTAASTVTMSGTLACLDINVSSPTVTFTCTAYAPTTLTVSGSLNFTASGANAATWSYSGDMIFNATTTGKTITTSGTSFASSFIFNGIGGYWTLASNLSCGSVGNFINQTGGLTLTAGTLDTSTSNYSITTSIFNSSGTGVRTLKLNGSTVNISGGGNATGYYGGNFWNTTTITNFTFNAGTSSIIHTNDTGNSTVSFADGGLSYYNVSLQVGFIPNWSNIGLNLITTSSTSFRNLTLTPQNSSTLCGQAQLNSNLTVTNLFTVTGGSIINRIGLVSVTAGTAYTVTAASVSLSYVDFQDFTGAGAATWSGTSIGNAGNNSNITFDSAKTVYFVGTTASNWWDTKWSTASGGSVLAANFPLAQDTAVIDNSSLNTGLTLTCTYLYYIGSITCTSRSNAIVISGDGLKMLRNLTLSSSVTWSGSLEWQTRSGTAVITASGATYNGVITVTAPGSTVQLGSTLTSSNSVTHTRGTVDLNNYNLTCSRITSTSGYTRTLAIGTGTLTVTSSTTVWNISATGLTVTGSGRISLTSASAKSFAGAVNYGSITLDQGGAGAMTITGANTFGDITASYTATGACTIIFPASTTTTVTNFTASGTSGNLLTLNSSTSGTKATLSKASGTVSASYLSIKDIAATGGATWQALSSTDAGNNTGWSYLYSINIGSGITIGRGITIAR